LNKVVEFERVRLGKPSYTLPKTFHGRDVFAVVAAAIAGGIEPEFFADDSRVATFQPKLNEFSKAVVSLPTLIGETVAFQGLEDETGGNIKTSLFLPTETVNKLLDDNAEYLVWRKDNPNEKHKVSLKEYFAQVDEGELLIYQGSSYSLYADTRFFEIAVNSDSASKKLGLDRSSSKDFVIQRVH
jgi:S-adenosylmethionine hydrolase